MDRVSLPIFNKEVIKMMMSMGIGLIYYLIGAFVLYGIIRLGVKHGIQDTQKDKQKDQW